MLSWTRDRGTPRAGPKGVGMAPPMGGLLGGAQATIGYGGTEEAGTAE